VVYDVIISARQWDETTGNLAGRPDAVVRCFLMWLDGPRTRQKQ